MLVALLAYTNDLWQAAIVACFLLFYLSAVRLTRCRVETKDHRPCLWRVRGLLGTCDFHVGYKRGLPRLVRGPGFAGLPMFMWPRDDFAGNVRRVEPQPSGLNSTAVRARRPGYDWVMMGLTAAGVLVAIIALFQ